jgi:threonine aldolase
MKQHGAVLAKGRLLGVQFGALFEDGLYERIGVPAVCSARRIREKLEECGYSIPFRSFTNQIFVILEDRTAAAAGCARGVWLHGKGGRNTHHDPAGHCLVDNGRTDPGIPVPAGQIGWFLSQKNFSNKLELLYGKNL